MTGIIYDLKTKQVLLTVPDVIEVGNDYILGKDASAKGVDLTKAGILVVEENVKEGEIIDLKKLVDKKNEIKSPLQEALDKIAKLEDEIMVIKENIKEIQSLKTTAK